jgi:hypothetical protein
MRPRDNCAAPALGRGFLPRDIAIERSTVECEHVLVILVGGRAEASVVARVVVLRPANDSDT